MTSVSNTTVPFYAQYSGGSVSSGSSAPPTSANAAGPIDVVDLRNAQQSGGFTASAGDKFALSSLYTSTAPAGSVVQNYKVALRSDQAAPYAGQLLLAGVDVSSRQSFSPYEFSQLSFVAGPLGSKQDLLVVAQTGTLANDDTLTNPVDSPAVQITASVTGTRSINAAAALQTTPTGADAAFVALAQEATTLNGTTTSTTGATATSSVTKRASLATVGNLTASAGDRFALASLYTATAPAGGLVQNYKVAFRGDQAPPYAGQLTLAGIDVSSRQSFSPYEFSQLSFVAGPLGSTQDLLVVAQTGTLANDDTLTNPVDSPAVQITASVTGTRSINAAAALQTTPTGADVLFLGLAQEAAALNGITTSTSGATTTSSVTPRASVTTAGNFSAAAGDKFALSSLYAATPPAGGTIQYYLVAFRGDQAPPGAGQLTLAGVDVSERASFSAYEFSQLSFTAGPLGSRQDLLVVAQTGTLTNDDTLTNPVDSVAVQITASVTGTRSINAAAALQTTPTGADAGFLALAQEATTLSGTTTSTTGATTTTSVIARASLATVGNLTASAGDKFALASLYTATAPAGGIVQNYKVAFRGDQAPPYAGQLTLAGVDVSARQSFSPYEFNQLSFVAGPLGSKQDLLVVAQTGTLANDDTLTNPVDSPAVQITASVTGTRSINAAAALLTTPTGADAGFLALAQEATTLSGTTTSTTGVTTTTSVTARASVATVGNLTASAGDKFALASLYTATAPAGGLVQNYKVAFRGDQAPPYSGQLTLAGVDVSSRQSFSPYEFSQLSFVAGPLGSKQDLLVVAQTGTLANDDTLTNPVDSPAVQITASVTGTRSINAAAALLTTPTGADAGFVALAQEATTLNGTTTSTTGATTTSSVTARASLSAVGTPDAPQTAVELLANLLGAFQSTSSSDLAASSATATSVFDVLSLYPGAVGGSGSARVLAEPAALATWNSQLADPGGYQVAGSLLALQRFAVAAYQSGQKAAST